MTDRTKNFFNELSELFDRYDVGVNIITESYSYEGTRVNENVGIRFNFDATFVDDNLTDVFEEIDVKETYDVNATSFRNTIKNYSL